MARLVSIDLPDASEGELGTDGWVSVRRVAMVDGLTGNTFDQIRQAAECPGMPQPNEFHPVIPDVQVSTIRPVVLGGGNARVDISYTRLSPTGSGEDGGIQVEWSTSLQSEQTNVDSEGQLITVEYKNEVYPATPTGVLRPMSVVRLRTREASPPDDEGRTKVGRVNFEGGFNLVDRSGGKAQTWLYSSLHASTADGGAHWDKTREFAYNENRWVADFRYVDETGRTPDDVFNADGDVLLEDAVKLGVQMYEMVDFNSLFAHLRG